MISLASKFPCILEALGLYYSGIAQRRNCVKSIDMYKIVNEHGAPNLKRLFPRCNEGDSPYDLRNRETDLVLLKPKKEFLKRSFKYNGAIIGIICLPKQKPFILFSHSRELNLRRGEGDLSVYSNI